jgi:hypothetical protein
VVRASRLGWVVEGGVVAVWGGVGVEGVLAAAGAGFVCAFWLQAVKLEDSFRIVVLGLHSVTAIFCCWAVAPVDGQCQSLSAEWAWHDDWPKIGGLKCILIFGLKNQNFEMTVK